MAIAHPKSKTVKTAEPTKVKPVHKVTMFPVSASIWERHSGDGSVFYSVSFQRAYKNGDDEWQYSDNFGVNELLLLAKVADYAHSSIQELREAQREHEDNHKPVVKKHKDEEPPF